MGARAATRSAARAAVRSAKVYVGKSRIHGRGLFASEPIRTGEAIGRFEGRATRRNGCYVLWVHEEGVRFRGIEGTTDLRFVNHSKSPNAEFVQDMLMAIRTIQSGDEITCHYGECWEDEAS